MEIDVCDKENVWSSATIVKLNQETKCKIRYNGWGSEWDEVLDWKDNERLARNSHFTMRALCIVDLKSGKRCFWPCKANLRMPNPKCSVEGRCIGEQSLRQERNVFIQPYGLKEGLFTEQVAKQFINGGKWIDTKYITEWRNIDELSKSRSGFLKNLDKAYKMAKGDKSVKTSLPKYPFEKGSLLKQIYRTRVTKRGGARGRPNSSLGFGTTSVPAASKQQQQKSSSGVKTNSIGSIAKDTEEEARPQITDYFKRASRSDLASSSSSQTSKMRESLEKTTEQRSSSRLRTVVKGSQRVPDIPLPQTKKETKKTSQKVTKMTSPFYDRVSLNGLRGK